MKIYENDKMIISFTLYEKNKLKNFVLLLKKLKLFFLENHSNFIHKNFQVFLFFFFLLSSNIKKKILSSRFLFSVTKWKFMIALISYESPFVLSITLALNTLANLRNYNDLFRIAVSLFSIRSW
jgi:hypothetical protein